MTHRVVTSWGLVLLACGSSAPAGHASPDSGTSAAEAGHEAAPPADARPGRDAASPAKDSGSGGDGGAAGKDQAIIIVHYPAGGHAIAVRGGGGGLDWTTGTKTSRSGDAFRAVLTGVTGPVEWKPLLDDSGWAIGPNYHAFPGQTVDVWPHFKDAAGNVTTLFASFHSTVLSDDRAIYAYLPASYAENTDATYPVVYMHDGQNLWAAHPELAFSGTWNVDRAFDAAGNLGACSANGVVGWGAQPLGGTPVTCTGDGDCPSHDCRTFPEAIVIGVANDANRVYEYTPTVDPTETSLGPAGGADDYLTMLVSELKPQVDAMLRTRPDVGSTAMAGSSLGGLVTAYAGLKHPDVYGQLAELSPSSWWDSDTIVSDVKGTKPAPMRPSIVYVDSGKGMADDEADTNKLAAKYVAVGYVAGKDFRHVVQAGAQHNETYWAERFPGAMQFVLGVR